MSAQTSMRNLHNDKRGAIMLMGLCMSCFLIGSLWFLIGIGDAIVFRDAMQEATDHATFTSAALHAKGMNFISACNLFILALIAIHILLGLVHDVLLAVCILTVGFGCGAYITARRIYTTYSKVFKPIAGALHYAEVGAAYGYPLLAAYKGYTVGGDYGGFGPKKHDVSMFVVGPSLLPGGIIDSALNKAFTRKGKGPVGADGKPSDDKSFTGSSGKRFGLPVSAKKFADVCDLVGKKGVDALLSITGVGHSGVFGTVKGWIGAALKFRYCNDLGSTTPDLGDRLKKGNTAIDQENKDRAASNAKLPAGQSGKSPLDTVNIGTGSGQGSGATKCLKDNSSIDPGLDSWWGCDGPLVPWGGTSNGSPWNQVWGVNFRPSFDDKQEHRVAVGHRKFGVTSSAEPSTYFSEGEFYFDCDKEWGDEACNKDDNAGYSVQWRARLKRLEFPQVGELLGSFASQFIGALKVYKDFQKTVKDLAKNVDKDGKVITTPGQGGNPLVTTGFESVISDLFKTYVTKPVQGGINAAGKYADKLLDPDLGAYH
jgi:hypothetical protein